MSRIRTQMFLSLLSMIGLLAAQAQASVANHGWYGAFYGGYADISNNIAKDDFGNVKYQNGFNFSGQFGFKGGAMRYESEISYIRAKVKDFEYRGFAARDTAGETGSTAFMVNMYYDFNDSGSFSPFVGGGVGIARIKAEVMGLGRYGILFRHFKATSTRFAYQAMGGVNYHISPTLTTGIFYRFFGTSNSHRLGKSFTAHTANLGITYRFEDVYV